MGFGEAKTLGFNNQPLARLLVANSIINSKGMFFYSGTPALGNLIESVGVATAGVDPFGNVYDAGDTVYQNSGGVTKAAAQLFNGNVNVGTPAQFAGTGGASPAQMGLATLTPGSLSLTTGLAGSTDQAGIITVLSRTANGGFHIVSLNGGLVLSPETSITQQANAMLWSNASAYPLAQAGTGGDSILYNIGHKSIASGSDQLINSTVFADICGGNWGVAANTTYDIHAELTCTQGPNAAPNHYRLGFTGTISQVRMKMVDTQDNVSNFVATTTSNNGLLAAHAFGATTTYVVTIDGRITTTSTGTLSFQAAMDAAGNTFTVLALSHARIEPVT